MIKLKYILSLALYFLVGNVLGQSLTVSGKVTGDNESLPGVNIVVEGTTLGTVTDIDGNYTISLDESNATLIFSFIGYKTQSIAVNARSVINVLLEEDVNQLEEVVVIGYGSVRKSDLTGSVTSIKSEELIKSPAADPIQSLQGKVAGLQILTGSGAPGAESYVRLRGINTLNDNRVLYVVDGVIIDGGINFLNNQDIASIEVLKDASAKAIFGTRGANGVIIVTTKKGSGDAKISFSSEYGVEKIANKIGLMSGPDFANFINDITPGTYNNIGVLPNTDWQDLVFEDWKPIQTYTLSVSGASEKLNYYLSGGLFKQEGIVPKSDFERINLKLNTSYKVREYLKIGTSMTGIVRNSTNAPGVVNPAYWAWPINNPFNADGSFAEVQGSGNPLAAIAYSNSETKALRLVGNVYAEFTILKDFNFKSSYQFDFGNDKSRGFNPVYYVSPTQQNEENDLSVNFGETRSWIFENTLAYNKEFGVHRLNAIIGYSAQENNSEFLTGTRENLLGESQDLWYLNAGSSVNQQNSNGASARAINSILFRANYVYDDRYLLTATFRRDGSSSFGINNRYGNFPAFALGWNISNEAFFPSDISFDKLKIRASWGINGNQNIPFLDQYSVIGAGIDAVFGQNETINSGATFSGRPGNSNLKWEETTEFDFGLEFGLLEGRLTGEIDYYNRLTSDILVLLDLPGYAGAGAFVQKRFNAADVRNSGFDFVLNWQDEIGAISYGLGFTGNTVNNKVEGLGEGIPGAGGQIISGDLGNGQRVTITKPGESIGSFYGYKVIGVFQSADQLASTPRLAQQGVGDFIYADTDGNGILNADDRTVIGSWIPEFVYGFNANVGFKGLSLSLDFAGQTGNQIYNGKQAIRFGTLNYEDRFNQRWTGPGTSNTDPRASTGGINYNPSDYFIEDASFLKLRTITVSYNVPSTIIERLKLITASVYVRGTNLWNSTDYSGYTPELGGSDSAIGGIIDLGVYPTTKVISAGLNLTF